jgi:hypothetical protein
MADDLNPVYYDILLLMREIPVGFPIWKSQLAILVTCPAPKPILSGVSCLPPLGMFPVMKEHKVDSVSKENEDLKQSLTT